jgi:hypothetical protein
MTYPTRSVGETSMLSGAAWFSTRSEESVAAERDVVHESANWASVLKGGGKNLKRQYDAHFKFDSNAHGPERSGCGLKTRLVFYAK